MMSQSRKYLVYSTLLLLIAAIMRLVLLQDVPPGLALDEVLNAGIVTSILEGRHAIFFREGFGHEPLYHYLVVPIQFLLGDNILSIRLPAVFLGLLLTALTISWAKSEFGVRVALVAGLGLAISWWPIVFSRIGIRPILQPLLLVLVAWFWGRRPWLSGILLGLCTYTYTAARVSLLIPVVMFFYYLFFERETRTRNANLKSSSITLLTALVVFLPLQITLFVNPDLQQRVLQLSEPLSLLIEGDPKPVLEMTRNTLGVFSFNGDPRTTYSVPNRSLFDPLTSVLFYAGMLISLKRIRQPKYAYIFVWLGISMVPSAITPKAPSIIRLVGAMPVVYIFPGFTVNWMMTYVRNRRSWRIRPSALIIGLLGLVVLNVFLTIRDGFVDWPSDLKTRHLYQTHYLNITRHYRDNQEGSPVIADGFYYPLEHETVRYLLGKDLEDRWVQDGAAVVFPAIGNGRLYVPEFAAIKPHVAAAANLDPDPYYRSSDYPSFALYLLPDKPSVTPLDSPVTFENMISLMGYDLQTCTGDQPMKLISYWQVEGELPWDLTIFVHVIAPDASIVTQHDGLDAIPTRLQPGDSFIQYHELPKNNINTEVPNLLQIGLYRHYEGIRIMHDGEPPDRFTLLDDIDICRTE